STKRPAPMAAASVTARKKARVSAENVLATSVDNFGDKMMQSTRELTDALRNSNNNSSPERRKSAFDLVHKETWLERSDCSRLSALMRNGTIADEYISYAAQAEEERKSWVCEQLGFHE
ncbi:hypothetical protein C8F01DRAFT_932948, partial [Mycena amicta]